VALSLWLKTRKRHACPFPRPKFNPRFERLDHRLVLSTLTVTNIADTGVAGDGSLRGEIASAHSGDTIVFNPSLDGKTITLSSGELSLAKNLRIQGPGAGAPSVAVSGDYATRVFAVAQKAQVTLSDLTITAGREYDYNKKSGAFVLQNGGGILNNGALTISACTLWGNLAEDGGGVYNAGTLTVSDSSLTAANATGGNVAIFGGGIYNAGTLTVSNSALTAANGYGGNVATFGGGIYNAGTFAISGSTLSGNTASEGDGGGIYNSNTGTLAIDGCTLSNNSAADRGGGLFDAFGGRATVSGCTLSGNSAYSGVAIYNAYNASALTVSSSTFSDDFGAWYLDIDGPFTDGGGNKLG
jgi:hypothetical protein